jgi:hypothetical protein
MRTVTVKLASGFYADETVLEALMSIPEIYNAYVEGDTAFLEVDDAAAKLVEAVRMLMDLGYELVLPHFVFAVKKGDSWRVKDLVEKDLPPHVAASFFNVSSRLTYVVTFPDVSAEEATKYLAERSLRAELVSSYQGPVRPSFGQSRRGPGRRDRRLWSRGETPVGGPPLLLRDVI